MKTRIPLLLAALFCPSHLPAQTPGSLDTTFQAQTLTNFASPTYSPLTVQPDGKIIFGSICSDSALGPQFLARLNTDGTPDASFNATGIRCTGSGDISGYFSSIALQSDGKIVLGGKAWSAAKLGQPGWALARLNLDGSVDASFVPAVGGIVRKLVPLPSGECLIAFWNGVPQRLKHNGELDRTFMPQIQGAALNLVNDFAVQPDGGIVVSLFPQTLIDGQERNVIRLLPDGGYDPSFRPVLTDGVVSSVKSLPDGKILLGAWPAGVSGGFSNVNGMARPGLARLQADGLLDLDFIPFADDLDPANLATQHDGKIILAQFWKVPGSPTRQLVRLKTDGSRDETYVSGLRHELNPRDDTAYLHVQAMVLQPDGKLLVSTEGRSDDIQFGSIIRLHGDGVPYIVPASVRANSNRTVEFQLTAATNRTVVIEFSPNLKSGPWTMLATFPPAAGRETIQFSDSAAASVQQRFYRAVSP